MLGKMPGDNEAKFAGVRALLRLHDDSCPAKSCNIHGQLRFGQFNEWHYEYSLDWHLMEYPEHRKHQAYFKALNALYHLPQ